MRVPGGAREFAGSVVDGPQLVQEKEGVRFFVGELAAADAASDDEAAACSRERWVSRVRQHDEYRVGHTAYGRPEEERYRYWNVRKSTIPEDKDEGKENTEKCC